MSKIAKTSTVLSFIAALSHIFCCVLPLIVSVLSLSTVAGGALGLSALHEHMHDYELPILIFAGIMLSVSAISLLIARRLDCASDACCSHAPCAPRKNISYKIFWVALILFGINCIVLFLEHEKIL